MKKRQIIILLLLFVIIGAPLLSAADKFAPQQVKKILASPAKGSSVNFEIPVDLIILDVTDDLNWYKVRIGFDFLGHHEYEGWAFIPLGNYIKENEKTSKEPVRLEPLTTAPSNEVPTK